jgi:hypothetical protein
LAALLARLLEANFVSDAEEAGRSISEVVLGENHQKNSKTFFGSVDA